MGYIRHFDLLKALGSHVAFEHKNYMVLILDCKSESVCELKQAFCENTFKFVIALDLNEQIILHYFILHVCTYCCALSGSAMAVTNVNFVNYLLRNKFIDKVKVVFRCKAPQSTCLSFTHSSTHSDLSLWSVCNLCFMLLYVFSLI